MYEIDVEFVIKSDLATSSGFAIMLLKPEPEFPQHFGPLNGIREDFNGAGVFLYRSKTRKPGQWVRSTYDCVNLLVCDYPTQQRFNEVATLRGPDSPLALLPH